MRVTFYTEQASVTQHVPRIASLQSWLHTPEHAVPETSEETFTASVLEFLKAVPPD